MSFKSLRGAPSIPPFTIRSFIPEDLAGVVKVEISSFPGDHYPPFFFIQAHELFNEAFVIVENSNKEVTGYGIGAFNQNNNKEAWILSMGVLPIFARQGMGMGIMV